MPSIFWARLVLMEFSSAAVCWTFAPEVWMVFLAGALWLLYMLT